MTGTIVFTCWEKDESINIQLEPWALSYELKPGNEIKFIATQPTNSFHWALRIDHTNKAIQLFPESSDRFGPIQVFINDETIDTVD